MKSRCHCLHLCVFLLILALYIGLADCKSSLSKEQLQKRVKEQQQTQQQGGGTAGLHSGDVHVPPGLVVPQQPPALPAAEFDGVPPGFEKVLPREVVEQLRQLHRNQQIPLQEKSDRFSRILSSVPAETLAKLPLPPGFEVLPDKVQQKIRAIHGNPSLDWSQKHGKVAQLIEALPPDQRPRPPPGFPALPPPQAGEFFPPNPPPGFEKVLPPNVYEQLLKIHRDGQLSVQEKSQSIDQIMRSLPQHIIDQLPLPPGFDQLPEKYIKQARTIFGDKTLSFHEKDRKVFEFVRSLPANLRQLVRPPLPPAFERLNPETKEKIAGLFENEALDDGERQKRFWQLVNQLPNGQRQQVHDALNFPA